MFKQIAIASIITAAAITPAMAQTRASDAKFILANRCAALMASDKLGPVDGSAIQSFIDEQKVSREPVVLDMAKRANDQAALAAKRADDDGRAKLIAEREGRCKTVA
jgi:hypothetical protein